MRRGAVTLIKMAKILKAYTEAGYGPNTGPYQTITEAMEKLNNSEIDAIYVFTQTKEGTMTDKAKIKLLRKAVKGLLDHAAGTDKQCGMCGGDGETLDFHPGCPCKLAREALTKTKQEGCHDRKGNSVI